MGAGARLPRHIAIVMDGNGRWAQRRGLPRTAGHRAGVEAVRRTVEGCRRRGIAVLTLFAFSSENWRRPRAEVRVLMDLFTQTLGSEVARLHEHGIRVRFVGERRDFGPALHRRMAEAEELTRDNRAMDLVLAVGYGGRWDIAQAARRIAAEAADGRLDPSAVDEEAVAGRLSLAGLPDPDLFIRTGGERRISNFLLWHLAYTELHFTDTLWPDFDEGDLEAALADYAGRQRRFGRTGEQAEALEKAQGA
ncbi:polyprenyl diphosphate synthase [Inmirania thermothiophila]|uniref:Ditrans,polycis-undecaprenyl-diphosphate synthase ((2E,6E)-farnesyl-diphosphate specific) n=1 Tax=Inmirania thermothiophila TaxID=1750597 RepID=A0A3N1Y108_9GAMM|nr:polyprenyl diphosphate synthase [Inmirania thermothiophila]ROR32218.1 undecaprenyl diphosphate synthase [Inmirania thermothiophila]